MGGGGENPHVATTVRGGGRFCRHVVSGAEMVIEGLNLSTWRSSQPVT